jgi:hypothetical protein
MDIAYLHVVINHLPIMGVPIALGLLLLGTWARDDSIKRAALLSFVVLGLLAVPVFLTGKGGEDFIEHVPGVSHDAIDAHEDMATLAFLAIELLAALSLYLFLRHGGVAMLGRHAPSPGSRVPGAAGVLVMVVAIVASGMLGYAGRLGGKISHTEFAADAEAGMDRDDGRDEDRGRRRRRGRD